MFDTRLVVQGLEEDVQGPFRDELEKRADGLVQYPSESRDCLAVISSATR
jgi:hypothetical protein